MTKVTYANEINGLSCTFSTDTPLMFPEDIDGCSCGCDAITYRPLNLNGQRFVSSTLTARTVVLTVNFGGISGGKYSRKEAFKRWEEIQRVFVPGNMGTLTWTNGTESRFIKCRTAETPKPSELLPYLFRAAFSLTADYPMWFDSVENVAQLSTGGVTIENPCGLEVPFIAEVSAASDVFVMVRMSDGAGIGLANRINEDFTIDTAACTVTTASGELVNNQLNVNSQFFGILPGTNRFNVAGHGVVTLKWRKAYMGIF